MKLLEGLRVVDFSKVLAGPLCTQYLGDMGAEIIKVEAPLGDDTRRWPPFRNGDGTVFLSANRNKRSIVLDMKSSAGREAAHRLIKTADIVVESFGPGVTQRLGIDYESARELRPDIVYCSITGFGTTGPLSRDKGYDVILQAYSGMMALTGERDGQPVRSPISPIDQTTGIHAALGIVGAIVRKLRTGEGTKVEASLFDTSVAFMGYVMQSFWERGTEPQRWGSAHESLCPYQVFDAQDKPFLLGVANDSLWQAFCRAANDPELAQEERFLTNAGRVEHRPAVLEKVAAILAKDTRDNWLARLSQAGIPCAPILGLGEMVAHPHTEAAEMVQRLPRGDDQDFQVVAQPLRFDGERPTAQCAPPSLGQHTREVLLSLGYTEEEIEEFAAAE